MLDTSVLQKEMEKLPYLCTVDLDFSYGGRIYIQGDGLFMSSPLGSVLANVFVTELEIVMISSLGNYLQTWKRFVGDTFAFVLPDKINSFNTNIQFTFETEEESKVAFLDVMVIRNTNDTINTTVYGKSTNTDIYINWHPHSPLQWKNTIANVLIQRAIEFVPVKSY